MSEFKSLLSIENLNDVYVRREAAKVEVTNTVNKLKSLDILKPNLRQFTVLDKELEYNLKGLRDDNHVFILSLLHESPAITQDSEFGKDQGVVWSIQFEALKEKDNYQQLLEKSSLFQKPSGTAVNMVSSNTATDAAEITSIVRKIVAEMQLSTPSQTGEAKQTDQPEKPKLTQQQAKPKAEVLNVQDSIKGPWLTDFMKRNKVGDLSNDTDYSIFISKFCKFTEKVGIEVKNIKEYRNALNAAKLMNMIQKT